MRLEDNNKPYLEVPYNSFQNDNWDIITGSFNGLDKVTFYECDLGGGKGGRGGYYKRIHFSFMFENEIIERREELIFEEVSFNSGALEDWILDNSVSIDIEYSKNAKQLTIPAKKTLHKVKTRIGTIAISRGFDSLIGSRDARVDRKSTITILFNEPMYFDEINQLCVQLKRLILFLTHESPQIDKYNFIVKNILRPIILKERSRFNKISGFSEGIELNYLDVNPHLETLVKNWIENDKLVQVIELIQEKYMNTELSFQSYFLNCCVALESFHSKIIQKKSSLRERITFFKNNIESIKNGFSSISPIDFIDNIVNTRNKIAHEGEYLKYLTELELLLYGKVLEFVVKIEILKTLGIQDEKLLENFQTDARDRVRVLAEMNGYN